MDRSRDYRVTACFQIPALPRISCEIFFFFFNLFLAALGLRCCAWSFSFGLQWLWHILRVAFTTDTGQWAPGMSIFQEAPQLVGALRGLQMNSSWLTVLHKVTLASVTNLQITVNESKKSFLLTYQSRGGVPAGAALFHLVFQGPRLLPFCWLAIFQHEVPKVTLKVISFFFFKTAS